jgi:hypothetical protein
VQRQSDLPHAQAVAQVHTGSQLQLQSWQLQEAFNETADSVGLVFIDLVFMDGDGAANGILHGKTKNQSSARE